MKKETRELSSDAYQEIPGEQYKPYIGKLEVQPEFTFRAIFTGMILGVIFAAANAYIGLKVGLTVSASIPVAVMAVAIFRIIGKNSILENNMVQTVGSAGESLAAGVIFTFPALIIWGMKPELIKIFVFSLLGGWLGVLFMIPLRNLLISKQHGRLPYPEGTACAEVLVAGDKGGTEAKTVFTGLGIGSLYEFLMNGLKFWNFRPSWDIPSYKGAKLTGEITPALLGVGIGSETLPAPQATLMSLVVKGVITGELPWNFVIIGIFLAAIVELIGIRSLPFAVGVYLPFYLTTQIMVG